VRLPPIKTVRADLRLVQRLPPTVCAMCVTAIRLRELAKIEPQSILIQVGCEVCTCAGHG